MEKKDFDLWVNELFSYQYLTECIPNNDMHQFLLNNIEKYSDETILNILRCLLHSYNRPLDRNCAKNFKKTEFVNWCNSNGVSINKSEYYHRLINDYEAWEGLTWIVQLIRISPIESIRALSLYLNAECATMPDFRLVGIGQCIDIIEKKFVKNCYGKDAVLHNIGPREFEVLIYKLYCSMGYDAVLTPATRDGGKDVIASKKCSDGTEKLYIECKRYITTELKIDKVRAFAFTVLNDNSVSRGIMFTTVKINSQLKDLHPRINVLEFNEVIVLLNSYLGYNWDERIDRLISID